MYRSLHKATSLLIGDFYNQFFKQNVNQGMGQSIKVNTVVTKVRFFIHKTFFKIMTHLSNVPSKPTACSVHTYFNI